jgi:hypothetical protein
MRSGGSMNSVWTWKSCEPLLHTIVRPVNKVAAAGQLGSKSSIAVSLDQRCNGVALAVRTGHAALGCEHAGAALEARACCWIVPRLCAPRAVAESCSASQARHVSSGVRAWWCAQPEVTAAVTLGSSTAWRRRRHLLGKQLTERGEGGREVGGAPGLEGGERAQRSLARRRATRLRAHRCRLLHPALRVPATHGPVRQVARGGGARAGPLPERCFGEKRGV